MSQAARPARGLSRVAAPASQKIPLRCSECGKHYFLDPKFIEGKKSATFQCTRCGSIFEQSFVKALPAEASEPSAPQREEKEERGAATIEGQSVHSQRPGWMSIAALVAGATVLFALAVASLTAFLPLETKIFPLDVSEENVTLSHESEGGKYVFSGVIRNSSEQVLRNIEVEIQLFANNDELLSSHRVKLIPSLVTSPASNVQLTDAALSRAAFEVRFAPGEDFAFSVPLLINSEATPSVFTVRATGRR